MNGEFEYFYGEEALTFAFYRIPKVLLTHERFKGLSVNAILLYGLLLDRTSLSVKNDWIDDENRVYIIYTIDSIMADMSCAKASAVKYLKELTEIGLVEKVRQGLGKADVIYVKNFSTILKHNNAIPSRTLNFSDKEESNILSIDNTHIYDETPDLNLTMQIIKERMDYSGLVQRYKADDKRIDEIVSLILDVLTSNAKTIRINKENKSINVVKSVFSKVDMYAVEYVLECLNKYTDNVGNMRNFLLTTIYNSVLTKENAMRAQVNFDLYGEKHG